MTSELGFESALALADSIRSRRLSPVELVDAALARIEDVDPLVNAVCTIAPDARERASEAERAILAGVACGPLHGVPVAIKDTFFTGGLRTTAGSKLFADFVPEADATCVGRLRAAGAIVIGKTNVPELAYTGATSNALFGTTRNPWNLRYTPGGSSGGTAAAVAAGYCPLGLGSDGGGSIRAPASFCGLVGLKPTFGLVPITPGFAGWDTLLHAGPMTRGVADAAVMLDVMAGPDPADRLSLPRGEAQFLRCIQGEPGIGDLRIGWAPHLGGAVVDPDVLDVARSGALKLGSLAREIDEISGWATSTEDIFRVLLYGESAGYVASRLDEARDLVDPGLVSRAEAALALTAADYAVAQWRRREFDAVVAGVFERYDLLVTPTVPTAPFPADVTRPEEMSRVIAGQPVSDLARTAFTHPFNLSGNPACSVPAGFVSEARPVGLQIVGPRFADELVLRAARAYEVAFPWAHRRPDLGAAVYAFGGERSAGAE